MGVTGESKSTQARLRFAGEDAGGVIGFIVAVVGLFDPWKRKREG